MTRHAVIWSRPRIRRSPVDAPTLHAADAAALVRRSETVEDPVMRVVLDRARAGSRPRARVDDHVVCLAIEGGGMRGAISAGMCVVLETAGLVNAFDRIYGVSAGALNACATATGQAALSATHYQDAASRRVVNPLRPLVRQPVIDYDLLFEDVIAARKPLPYERLTTGPEFRSLATSTETLTLRVLAGFADAEELLQAVRVSAALPRLGGDAPAFRGEPMVDGAMIEPIPFDTALAEGASHVLVLRSRPAGYRKSTYGGVVDSLALGGDRRVAELIRAGHAVYNGQATRLEHREIGAAAHVLQVAVPDDGHGVSRLRADSRGIVDAVRLGARAMASAVLVEPIDLCWQPVVCRTTTAEVADRVRLASSSTPATASAS